MLSFKNYLTEASLSKTQLDKRDNYEVFAEKIRDGIPFITNDGEEVVVGYNDKEKNKEVYNQIIEGEFEAIRELFSRGNSVILPLVNGGEISLTKLKKTGEFGGIGRTGTEDEDIQIKRLNGMIEEVMQDTNMPYVPIKVAGETHDVVRFEKTPGTPKSDIHGVDVNGNEVIWLSLKKGKRAKDFGQYGGMTPRGEPVIARDKAVMDFVKSVKQWVKENNPENPNTMPRATTLAREIPRSSRKLAGMSVYGNEYGSKYGRQNVQMILQGKLSLKKRGDSYEIVSSGHQETNPKIPSGSYEPVLMVMYKGAKERKNYDIRGARFSIYAKGGRKITEYI
mgnify:CR=1 FL=1